MSVRRLAANDYDALRALRLEALELYPENFASGVEEEAAMTRGGMARAACQRSLHVGDRYYDDLLMWRAVGN